MLAAFVRTIRSYHHGPRTVISPTGGKHNNGDNSTIVLSSIIDTLIVI